MAELILGSVVDSIAGRLVSLVSEEIGLARGVRLELEKLQGSVSIIGGVLREAEKRQVEAEDVKEWLKRLRDVAYDADNLLDDFSTEVLRRGKVMGMGKRMANEVRIFFSTSNQLIYASKMAHRIIEIRERIDVISNDRVRILLEGSNSLGSLVENQVRPQTYPSEPEPYVIGRDQDKKEIIDFLLNPDFEEDVSILPIVGFGGMGKTTLARSVFNDEHVRQYFEIKFWICVSTNFNVEDILWRIVQECSPNKKFENVNLNELINGDLRNANMNELMSKDPRYLSKDPFQLDMNELRRKLGVELHAKRFLLVLDDVWNDDRREWLKLEGSLTNSAKGSKILVTTRYPRVARTMAAKFHQLSGLPKEESLSLLMRMAMKQDHEWRSQNLEMIAIEILKKCAGVPLAIMTIGRLLLFSRNTEEDWLNFTNNDLSRINQKEDDIMPSLKLSYDFLPSHLKQLFAYCSLFPKDYELNPFELIHLWMAQGYIKSTGARKTLEEVGQEYFMELVSRSFFQDLKEDICGNIIGCKMHDLMHDLAMSVAGDNCIIVNISHDGKIPQEARHVSMVDMQRDELKRLELNQKIRSLLLINEKIVWIEPSYLDISCLRNLRALCLLNVQVDVSGFIGKLKHLRSLDLSGNNELRSLPNSISRLCNLETLILKKCRYLERLPEGITKLVNLRQLDIDGCDELTHLPRGIGNLTSLQMLSTFVVGKKKNPYAARLNELSKFAKLRKDLSVLHLERLKSISSELDTSFSIENFCLQSLALSWGYSRGEHRANDEEVLERFRPHPHLKQLRIDGYRGAKLSSWVIQLRRLVEIEMDSCYRFKHLPSLHHLPLLKRLSLKFIASLEWMEVSESETVQQSFFPSLEVLELDYLPEFKGWKWRRGNINVIEQEEDIQVEDEEDSSSLPMLPAFSDKVKVNVSDCPKFSYMHQQALRMRETRIKNLQQLEDVIRQAQHSLTVTLPMTVTTPMTMTFISTSSISITTLTSLTIDGLDDFEHLPMELFKSLPSLQSLAISNCRRLKSFPGGAVLRYLSGLEKLKISLCPELDLSVEDNDGDDCGEGMHDHRKLHYLKILDIEKMESLPRWIHYLSELKNLEILYCNGLKSLSGWLILHFLTNLESLVLQDCQELHLTGESEGQEVIPRLQVCGPNKLRMLRFQSITKMKTLPWWIQHLTNLEVLILGRCSDLKALPEWFPQLTSLKRLVVYECWELSKSCKKNAGKDWPKISHIQEVRVDPNVVMRRILSASSKGHLLYNQFKRAIIRRLRVA